MSELAGFQIDILIGTDILSQYKIRIRWNDGVIDVGDDVSDGTLEMEMSELGGVPVFPLSLNVIETNALFDTGAHLSYVEPSLVNGMASSGERDDFHPIAGNFTAPIYSLPTALGKCESIDLDYGTLPSSLAGVMSITMAFSDSKAVVGTQLLEYYDCTRSCEESRISWTR